MLARSAMGVLVLLMVGAGAYALREWNKPQNEMRTIDPRAQFQLTLNDLQNGAGLRVTIGDAAGTDGYSSLQIDEMGGCVYTYAMFAPSHADPSRTIPTWRQASFGVNDDTVRELRQLLVQLNFPSMKALYSQQKAGDSVQRFIKVEAGGRLKGVYCDNCLPRELQEVRAFLESHVIAANRDTIALAPLADGFDDNAELAVHQTPSFDD